MNSSTTNSSTRTRTKAGSRLKGFLRAIEASGLAVLTVALLLGLPERAHAYLCSTPSFAAHREFPIGSSSISVAVGDFNHDANMDLAVTNGTTGSVSILLGDGTGGFGAASDIVLGGEPISVAVGYFDNDANLDLAVADFEDGSLRILMGNGLGGFGAPTSYFIGVQPYFVVVGKFNGDAKTDVAVLDYSNGGEVSLLLNNGDGTFGSPAQYPAGTFPVGVAVGDFDGNFQNDLAVANLTADAVSVLLGNAGGTFGTPNAFPVGSGSGPVFVAAGDFDGDLKQDLAVANLSAGSVSVLRGNGSGGFGPPTSYTVGTYPVSVALADVNGDGKQDMVVANDGSNTMSVLLGDGSGGFEAAVDFPLAHSPGLVALADFNHDGKPDIVVTNVDTNSVSVLLNACGNPVHDTVVLPVKPVAVTIPAGKPSVTKNLSVKVRNADPTHTAGYNVKLAVDDSDCPGTVASTPDFSLSQPGAQDSVLVADGRTKTARVVLTINASAFASFNHNAPHRCTLWFTSSADVVEINGDPTLTNNTLPVELSVTDLNDANQTAVHETTIASLNPLALNITSGKPSKTVTVRPKVGNADASESLGDLISAAALDGNCPAGTVDAVDLSPLSGIQSSAVVAGGAKKSGTLKVTGTNALCTPNKLAPQRCIAMVRATGPGGDTDGTNNITRLVIDMVDKNDSLAGCVP